ncbi:unnamed protein product [Rodentolepis nana]|uniref:Uncharacterized protein n=1 Tax=Rodentolepis nana TaxID=102285 RepID=A0A0R3TV02_RODNA|nr:unnamed protein product [Rodentolepis nana]
MVLKEAKSRMRKSKKLCDGSGSEHGDESTWSTVSTESYVDYIGEPINLPCAMIMTDANEQKTEEQGNAVETKKGITRNARNFINRNQRFIISNKCGKPYIVDTSNDLSDLVNNKDIMEQLPEDKTEISEIVSEIASVSEDEKDILELENSKIVTNFDQLGGDFVSAGSFREVKNLEEKEQHPSVCATNNKISTETQVNERKTGEPQRITFADSQLKSCCGMILIVTIIGNWEGGV